MKQSYVIFRHWEADYWWRNPDDFFPDIEWSLTPLWINQSETLALRLATKWLIFDTIYSSPKERAIQTAEIVTKNVRKTETQFEVVHSISPRFYGDWEQQRKKDFITPENEWVYYQYPHFRPPHGESNFDVYSRVQLWIESILEQNKATPWSFAISTHSKVFDCLRKYFQSVLFRVDPFSIPPSKPEYTELLCIEKITEKDIIQIVTDF